MRVARVLLGAAQVVSHAVVVLLALCVQAVALGFFAVALTMLAANG